MATKSTAPIFTKILNLLKPIEWAGERERHSFNFSGAGRDQNLKFTLYFNRAERGLITYVPLESGEVPMAKNMLLAGRDVILPADVDNVYQQMEVLEVSPVIASVVTTIVAGLRAMEVSVPVFSLSKSEKRLTNNEVNYIFGLVAFILDDAWEPIGRITFTMNVFKMSPLERTALTLKAQEREKKETQVPTDATTRNPNDVVVIGGGNDRYKLSAMIQPGSVARAQLERAKEISPGLVREVPQGGSYEGVSSGHNSLTADCRVPGSK